MIKCYGTGVVPCADTLASGTSFLINQRSLSNTWSLTITEIHFISLYMGIMLKLIQSNFVYVDYLKLFSMYASKIIECELNATNNHFRNFKSTFIKRF